MSKFSISQLAVYIPAILIVVIIALLPFHAFLTVFGSSLIGHYTALRLWKEYLIVICLIGVLIILFIDKASRQLIYHSKLIQLIFVFFIIELILGIVSRVQGEVSTKALFYGWLSDCRYLAFFIICLIIAKKTSLVKNKSIRLILWPAVIVIIFGLLEVFVLPSNFLSHFGYGPNTIMPYQTINSNSRYVRILSTLRGSDPLGAYLLVPLSLATVLFVKGQKRWQMAIFFIAGVIVMIFSFSRSAWLGLVVAVALSIYLAIKSTKLKRQLLYMVVGLIVIFGGIFIAERNNHRFQNLIFHTQSNSSIKVSSDQAHLSALKTGLKQLFNQPLGKGPGTAGPASAYNTKGPRIIPENYYLQIAIETGWLGLIVFLAINLLVILSLWARRDDTLSLALLTSFIGLIIVNMLLEAWTDDTLCYIWWGLAAVAIASRPKLAKYKKNRLVL